MRYQTQYHTACQIQRRILKKMGLEFQDANHVPKPINQDDTLSPKDLAALSAAWNTLEERKRILRMKPKPKDQDVSAKPTKTKIQSFRE